MMRFFSLLCLFSSAFLSAADVLILRGAPGNDDYAKRFQAATEAWQAAGTQHQVALLDSLEALRAKLSTSTSSSEPLWLVFIGHGTSDPRDAHFNLTGPDLSTSELASLLKPVKREVILIDTTAASGPFIKALSGPRRTIVTATKGADEVYFTRFGQFFATAIGGLNEADQDQDKQVSVLEAFLFASRETRHFYEKESRISTEHSLLDDNGDTEGTRSESFSGLRAKPVKEGAKPDGERASQLHLIANAEEQSLPPEVRAQRDALEAKVHALVAKRSSMTDDVYYKELESLFVQIARLTSVSSDPKTVPAP